MSQIRLSKEDKQGMKKKFQKAKSLPTYIGPLDPGHKPVLVRLRKINGKIYQDCDVYIGPKMHNSSWQFDESPWVNIFHYATSDRKKNLEMYENYLRNSKTLRLLLHTLIGKRLGCFCDNEDWCHAIIIIKLVEELCNVAMKLIGDMLFFKGEFSPFSNIWQSNFMSRTFISYNSSEQFRLASIARRMQDSALLEEIMQASGAKELCALSKAVTRKCSISLGYSTQCQVKDMIKAVQAKYTRCYAFNQHCSENLKPGTLLFEATSNPFWGCGEDLEKIFSDTQVTSLPGLNLVGWIILFVVAKSQRWNGDILTDTSLLNTDTDTNCSDKRVISPTMPPITSDRLDKIRIDDKLLSAKTVPLEKSCTSWFPTASPVNHGFNYLSALLKRFTAAEISSMPLQGLKMLLTILENSIQEFA